MDEREAEAYRAHRERNRKNQAEKSAKSRDLGEIPPPKNAKRREDSRRDLKLFCESYLSSSTKGKGSKPLFGLAWSKDHLKALKKTQAAILEGGLFALAMPRGSGKTTIFIAAVIWAVIYNHHKFALLIAANQKLSRQLMKNVKKELRENDLLLEDFPEICIAIRELEGIANRAKGQTHNGRSTNIVWGTETIILATIEGYEASGGIIQTGAILSAVRGANVEGVRPTLCLLDDPQTKRSAKSDTQTDEREEIIAADVLGLPGPGDNITALMAVTVIRPGEPGDLAGRFLDRKRHPEWQGERHQMLYAFPTNMELWGEYREIGVDAFNRDCSMEEVQRLLNDFYIEHQAEMNEGADVAWPERKPKRVSGLQYAMDLFFRDEAAFFAEFQNSPQERSAQPAEPTLTADQISRKVNQLPRGVVPLKAQRMTAFIDVHQDLLYWKICWWTEDFTGGIVDYGTWPDQKKLTFKLRDASPTIRRATGLRAILPAVRRALDVLATDILTRKYTRPDGLVLEVERLGEDANWGKATETVYEHAREHPLSSRIRPCHGKFVKPDKPMSEWAVQPEEKAGFHWVRKVGARAMRYLLVDTNFWKSFAHDGLALAFEERHSISLYSAKPHEHRLLAQHCSSEVRKTVEGKGGSVDLWTLPDSSPDNHYWDTLVGNCVIASEIGVMQRTTPVKEKKKLTSAEIRERRAKNRAA